MRWSHGAWAAGSAAPRCVESRRALYLERGEEAPMKMFAAGCVVAVLGTVAVQFASSATSTRTSGIPARVKALESKVKKLTTSVNALKLQSACLGVQGVTQFGNPAAGQGYVYTNDGGATLAITTGFDAPASRADPSFH